MTTTYDYVKISDYRTEMVINELGKGKYITSNYLSFGDYDSSCDIQRSNVQYIKDSYASNRYIEIIGHHGYTQIYLKNTKVNQETIDSLDEFFILNDEYYYEYQEKMSKKYFLEHLTVSNFPVLESAIAIIDPENSSEHSTLSGNMLLVITQLSMMACGEVYKPENSMYYYYLQDDRYNTDENVQFLVSKLTDLGLYSALTDLALDKAIEPIVARIYHDVHTDRTIALFSYCLQLQSYHHLVLYTGSIDYMTTHEYPCQELSIDRSCSKFTIRSIVRDVYRSICEYNCDRLDLMPI